MSLNVLVYLEHDGRRLQGDIARLVSKGNEVAQALGGFTVNGFGKIIKRTGLPFHAKVAFGKRKAVRCPKKTTRIPQ